MMTTPQRNVKMKWLARLHFWVMFFSFFFYLGLGLTLGPEFLYQDIRKKFFAFADDTIVITAVVPGPPAVPVVTATPTCVALVPRIVLDWADDTGTTSWDIDRDTLPLTTGLVASQYTDTAVVASTSYTYQVTAYGPMSPGVAVSALVSATTLDCASIVPVTVTIETLGDKYVAVNRQNIDLSRRRPKVTGTTNTPYAIIDITLTNPTIHARTYANANGYFAWIPPIKLDTGNHILSVMATDPSDSSRTGTDSFIFWTKNVSDPQRRSESGSVADRKGGNTEPFDFFIRVRNVDHALFQGENLIVDIVANDSVFPIGAAGNVFLSDAQRQDVLRLSGERVVAGMERTTIEKVLPMYLEPGVYRVRADITADGEITSREDTLSLKGLPFITIAGHEIAYIDAASYIGTFFFSLLFLFLFFLLFFVREYWLYLHRLRAITERQLARIGLLGSRKGVIQ